MNAGVNPRVRAGLLLEAALAGSAERMRDCWFGWRRAAPDYEQIQSLEARLLPYVWRRLFDNGLDDQADRRLRGIYKKTWYYNHHMLAVAAELQRVLLDAGIVSVLFKGAAMMLVAYPEIGLRKSADIDLYVSPADFPRAHRLLRGRYDRFLRCGHAIQYWGLDRRGVDLHRATSQWATIRPAADIDDGLLQRARPLRWQGLEFRVPDPTDLVYHSLSNVFSHHAPCEIPHRYWMLDVREMSVREPLDGDRLHEMVARQRATPLWIHHLRSAGEHLPDPLRRVLDRLHATPLRADEQRVDAAMHEVESRYAESPGRVPYVIWWLALRGVPGGGPVHALRYKGGYIAHRVGARLANWRQESLRPPAIRQGLAKYATIARLLVGNGGFKHASAESR
jgi:hypothetical protein